MTLQRDRAEDELPTACPDWLELRREADTRARDEGAAGLLRDLVALLGRAGEVGAVDADGAGDAVTDVDAVGDAGLDVDVHVDVDVVDVGAGTGANHRYLAPRLPLAQRWTALDHDAEALAHPDHGEAKRVVADVADLGRVLAERGARPRVVGGSQSPPVLVTCSALLDVLTRDQLTALADALAEAGCPALLALTVTGGVAWSPREPEDDLLREAFDGHQQRDARPGPAAADELGRLMEQRGHLVRSGATPWRLDSASAPDLVRRWLIERVDAALEHDPTLGSALEAWRARRLDQLGSGRLTVVVDHVDLLLIPPAWREAGATGSAGSPTPARPAGPAR